MSVAFVIRHYVPEEDLFGLSQLLTEIESIDCDGEDTSEEYLQDALARPNFRPNQDAWVVERSRGLIGYAAVRVQPSERSTVYVAIHPTYRRNGLGSQLLGLVLNRARELGSKNILANANEHNSASNLFLKHHQFKQVGSSGSLRLEAQAEHGPVEFSRGFTLKRYSEVNDPLILLKALNECYLGMWGHQHNPHPTEEERDSPRFLNYYHADDILLLFDDKNSIFGMCSVKSQGTREANGEWSDLLDGPGIVQKYRERVYQRPMVLAGIQHLRQKGIRPIILEFWGDNANALNIYRSLGFEMINHYIAYHKDLE